MSDLTLYDWFIESARRHPEEEALVVDKHRVTYRDLAAMSVLVSAALSGESPKEPLRVGLLSSRSLVTYAGYLGVLCLGAAVVPINPAYPRERVRTIAEAAGLDVIIVDEGSPAPDISVDGEPLPVLRLDSVALAQDACGVDLDLARVSSNGASSANDVYILFTSGSTGSPKGVPIRSSNLQAFLRFNIDRYGVGPGARLSQTFDLAFDPSVFDMFVAWGGGGTLVVPSQNDLYDPVDFVNRTSVTHWYSVPSLVSLARDLGTLEPGSMPGLRWSLFAGEQLTLDQARSWYRAAPQSRVENLYGPTELTVTVTSYRLPKEQGEWPETSNGSVPIGETYPHLEGFLADGNGVSSDDGEFCVRGPQRFNGYLDPGDNEGRFLFTDLEAEESFTLSGVPDSAAWYCTGDRVKRENGVLVHMGRIDLQVKIRGQRVELQEIEVAVRALQGVHEVVVCAQSQPNGDVRCRALFTGEAAVAGQLAARLKSILPDYMIPRRFVHAESLPINSNGKVDRKACAETLFG